MTSSGAPCGACKFLRRKCVKGCVFAPCFRHEQGATHFAAIHKVFGASNVSKLLAHLPVSDRCEAAFTISYEAQARLEDPIYGCVSHVFALQRQVVNLQAQLASLKEQTAQGFLNGSVTTNPNEKYYGNLPSYPQDIHNWFRQENLNMEAKFNPNLHNQATTVPYSEHGFMNPNSLGNYENSAIPGEDFSFASFGKASHSIGTLEIHADSRQWTFKDSDDFQSVAFGDIQNSREDLNNERPLNW